MPELNPSTSLVTTVGDLKLTSKFDGSHRQQVMLTVFDVSEGQYIDIDISSILAPLQRAIEVHRSGLRDWYSE